jgi:hypothetical protein
LIFAKHFAGGDAEQDCVTNLTSCTGNGDTDGLFAHGENSRIVVKRLLVAALRDA